MGEPSRGSRMSWALQDSVCARSMSMFGGAGKQLACVLLQAASLQIPSRVMYRSPAIAGSGVTDFQLAALRSRYTGSSGQRVNKNTALYDRGIALAPLCLFGP